MECGAADPSFATPRLYFIDLDKPPSDRWKHIVADHMPQLQRLLEYLDETEREEYGHWAGRHNTGSGQRGVGHAH